VTPYCPSARPARAGVTLVELMVALAVLGISAAVVTLALPRASAQVDTPASRIANARREAVERGRPVTISVTVDDTLRDVTMQPDGSVIAETPLHVDRFAGRPVDGAR
jgi:prepilin-type N-terminal cleavage/methylation domain-containing protein